MTRPGPAAPDDRHQQDEDRKQRLAALRTRLHKAAQDIRTPEDWARCLHTAARLPAETWPNILLISARNPDATLVQGYQAWRAVGRHVNREEQGIAIFAAAPQQKGSRRGPGDDEQTHSWRDADHITYVWDLSQTSGQPLPAQAAIPPLPGEAPPGLWEALCWLARREGYAVEREPGCPVDGTTLWAARRIRVLPGLTSSRVIWALAHQLGHVLLHHPIAFVPGATTTGCHGVQKAEADSVAFITCLRHGLPIEHTFASPQTWAGTDPRAQPSAAMLAAGQGITTAAATISRHLDHQLPRSTIGLAAPVQAEPAAPTAVTVASAPPPERDPRIDSVLRDAGQFYVSHLASSWVPAYLHKRGITAGAMGEWHIGYATNGWTTLTSYLRGRGHHDDAIQAAGLARISSRGTLIDHFRDRVMLPVHDEQGTLVGFIGRARPGTDPTVPKYLNGPATSTYQKGDLLFGLHHARDHLARGATPVMTEGPFDAIAVTLADPHRYAGLAPCGTALTTRQAAALSRTADPRDTGILVAFDDDPAGRKAAIRAYGILRPISDRLQSVTLSGKDPAEILETDGPAALRTTLQNRVRPLSAIVIDAHIDLWERRLQDPEGPLLAMRSTASLIAGLLPPDTAETIRRITRNKELLTLNERMRPVANLELPQIARALPADTTYQIIRTAEQLGFTDYSDVLAEVANAVTRKAGRPRDHPHDAAPYLAGRSFPYPPCTNQFSTEPATIRPVRPGARLKLAQTKRQPPA
jgi:DNA primase